MHFFSIAEGRPNCNLIRYVLTLDHVKEVRTLISSRQRNIHYVRALSGTVSALDVVYRLLRVLYIVSE